MTSNLMRSSVEVVENFFFVSYFVVRTDCDLRKRSIIGADNMQCSGSALVQELHQTSDGLDTENA